MNNLKHIEINIWKACNNKCIFCMSSNSALWDIKFIEYDLLKEKLKEYYKEWYNSVWFLWGDISIYPNLEDLFIYCKKLWYEDIQIVTNAMRFSDYEFSEKIVLAWLSRVNISIHSHISNIEDYLTWIPNWFYKKIKAIKNFQKLFNNWILKSPISINIVLNQKNYETIFETVLYFYKILWIKDIRINFIWLDDMIKENWNELKISYVEFFPYFKKLIYYVLKNDLRLTFDTIPACIFYKINEKISKYVINKFLWENLDYITDIDWSNKNIKFNWKDKKKNELKVKFLQCNKCIYNNICEWVRKEYVELYWNKEFISIT